MSNFKKYLITGTLTLLPAAASAYVLWAVIQFLDGIFADLLALLLGKRILGLGMILTLLVILLSGFLASNFIGKSIIKISDQIICKIPIANSIYKTVKQIVDAFYSGDKKSFKQVVLIEYPRKGLYVLAFLTGESMGEVQVKTDQEVINVFLPTTPNPTSGFLLFVPREDVIFLDMSVEDGLKMIISGGVVVPPYPAVKEFTREVEQGETVI
ncbi:DUF502 domain-containing protein [Desulfitibacter alkalitolerans]|uniref:DUF502 domain-containing protein n=1 Tax=Desulfitibacter alkalitolerans TaxID=264641 RepID=UPI000484BC49|nr:DUF502 domain-containing protein [Desulfitibacter alkalitolerans]